MDKLIQSKTEIKASFVGIDQVAKRVSACTY